MKFSHLLFLSIILFFSSCDNPFAITPGTQGKNVVRGIYKTTTAGDVYEIWGNPSSERNGTQKSKDPDVSDEHEVSLPVFYSLEVPYPNPFVASATVQYQLPITSKVSIWFETAYLPQSNNPLPNQSQVERSFRKVFLMKERRMTAGVHSIILSTLLNENAEFDENGERVAAGFYRVFIQAETFSAYHDIYIGGEGVNPPPGLGNFIYY